VDDGVDCPSEENLIRMAVDDVTEVQSLAFDLRKRELPGVDAGDPDRILGSCSRSYWAPPQPRRAIADIGRAVCQHILGAEGGLSVGRNLIRMALGDQARLSSLTFNLSRHEMTAVYAGDAGALLAKLQPQRYRRGAHFRRLRASKRSPRYGVAYRVYEMLGEVIQKMLSQAWGSRP
jgi:hypothetical protein